MFLHLLSSKVSGKIGIKLKESFRNVLMTCKPRNFQMITIQMVQYALERGGSSSSQDTTIYPGAAPSAFMKLNRTSYPDSLTCCQASMPTANCTKLSNAFRKSFFASSRKPVNTVIPTMN